MDVERTDWGETGAGVPAPFSHRLRDGRVFAETDFLYLFWTCQSATDHCRQIAGFRLVAGFLDFFSDLLRW